MVALDIPQSYGYWQSASMRVWRLLHHRVGVLGSELVLYTDCIVSGCCGIFAVLGSWPVRV